MTHLRRTKGARLLLALAAGFVAAPVNAQTKPTAASRPSATQPAAAGGAGMNPRLQKVVQPNGRQVYYNYPASGIGASLNRVDNIASAASASDSQKFASYKYLGGSTGLATGGRVVAQWWVFPDLPDHPIGS